MTPPKGSNKASILGMMNRELQDDSSWAKGELQGNSCLTKWYLERSKVFSKNLKVSASLEIAGTPQR